MQSKSKAAAATAAQKSIASEKTMKHVSFVTTAGLVCLVRSPIAVG